MIHAIDGRTLLIIFLTNYLQYYLYVLVIEMINFLLFFVYQIFDQSKFFFQNLKKKNLFDSFLDFLLIEYINGQFLFIFISQILFGFLNIKEKQLCRRIGSIKFICISLKSKSTCCYHVEQIVTDITSSPWHFQHVFAFLLSFKLF